MNLFKFIDIVKCVMQDPKVIAAFVSVLLYLNFAFYVARYQKKLPKVRKAMYVAPAAATEKKVEGTEADEDAKADEEVSKKASLPKKKRGKK